MKTAIGITEENRQAIADVLSKLLADEFILYTKTRNAHWNLEGSDFHDKHLFFEAQYKQLEMYVDQVAEGIRKLGHYAPATLKQYLELTHLSERIDTSIDSQSFIKMLLEDQQSIIIYIRQNIKTIAEEYKDEGTTDFITGLMQEHEEMAWMLRASLT